MNSRKTLILFEQIETFEQFLACNIILKNVEVSTPYKEVSNIVMHNIRAVSKRLPVNFVHELWLERWSKALSEYDNIIIFDNAITPKLLEYIKSHLTTDTKLKIWLWNIPNEHIDYLTKNYDVYCFDKTYSEKYHLKFIDQFYILDTVQEQESVNNSQVDFYFVGADKGRLSRIETLAKTIEDSGYSYHFDVMSETSKSQFQGIHFLDEFLTYNDVIKNIQASNVIVELNKDGQDGLTLRSLESIFYNKKLITNNINIVNYDFYHPNNILVWDENEDSDLKDFMDKPYIPLEEKIIKKYSFSQWLKKITE